MAKNNNRNNRNNKPNNNRGGNAAQRQRQRERERRQRERQRQQQSAPRPMPTPAAQPATAGAKPAEIKGIGQGIRLASVNNGIGKQQLNTLLESSGKDPGQIIRQLDKINTNLKDKGKGGINLKSGAANMLIRKASKARSDIFGVARRPFEFGTGKIGQQLGDMSGLNTPIKIPNRMMAGGGWTPGGKEFEPEFLTRGIDLTGRGSGKTVRGVGKNFTPTATPMEEEEEVDTGIEDIEPVEEELPEEEVQEEESNASSSGAGGLDLASWATGFKKAQSARQKLGRQAQGLSSQKKSPFKSWNS